MAMHEVSDPSHRSFDHARASRSCCTTVTDMTGAPLILCSSIPARLSRNLHHPPPSSCAASHTPSLPHDTRPQKGHVHPALPRTPPATRLPCPQSTLCRRSRGALQADGRGERASQGADRCPQRAASCPRSICPTEDQPQSRDGTAFTSSSLPRSIARHFNRSSYRLPLPTTSCTTFPSPPTPLPTSSRSRSAPRLALTPHPPPVCAFPPFRTIPPHHWPPRRSRRRHYRSPTTGSRPRPDNGSSSRHCIPSTVSSSGGPATRRIIPSSRPGSKVPPRRDRATRATRRRNVVVGTLIVMGLLRMKTTTGLQTMPPQVPSQSILHSECRMCARRALHPVRRMRAPPAAG